MDETTRLLADIRHFAEEIVRHRDAPCEFFMGHGCAVAMAHCGDDILGAVSALESSLGAAR